MSVNTAFACSLAHVSRPLQPTHLPTLSPQQFLLRTIFPRLKRLTVNASVRKEQVSLTEEAWLLGDGDADETENNKPGKRVFRVQGSCYGCGAEVQTSEPQDLGYVEPTRYEEKWRHRQLRQLICRRCQELSNGAMVPAVDDVWTKQLDGSGRRLVSPEQLRSQLTVVRDKRAVVLLLVDLLDASGSFLSRLRDLTGKNPVILIGTKVDLLPKGTDTEQVALWLEEMAVYKKLNVIRTCLVSSRTKEGLPEAAAAMRRERMGRDVYVVGAANVGKSAFVRALVREMSSMTSRQFDPAAPGTANFLPVESAMPGTTLQLISLQAFHSGGSLYDTPGLHLHHRVPHMLTPEETKQIHPRGRLRPFVPPGPEELTPPKIITAARQIPQSFSATYLWGGLARMDVVSAPSCCRLTFFGSPAMRVQALPLQMEGSEISSAEEALVEGEPFATGSVRARGGLRLAKEAVLEGRPDNAAVADIAISGVAGWVAIAAPEGGRVVVRVYAPVGIEAFVRPPMPCYSPAPQQS